MSEEMPDHPRPAGTFSTPVPAIRPWAWMTLMLILLAVAAGYAVHEHNTVKRLATQNSDVMSALDTTRNQVTTLSARINDLTTPAPQPPPAARSRSLARQTPARHRADDPRWKEVQDELARQQKQIDISRDELGSTRTELQGSIARTHDELVLLERKGERSYYEFELDKSSQFQRKGPIAIRLRKANTKHQYADLELMVDDFKLSQKHVNLYQPVIFYPAGNRQPAELVIITISNGRIHGYVSEPKYKAEELAAEANSSTNNVSAATTGSQSRPRLEPPKN